jgi:hypothetical protein
VQFRSFAVQLTGSRFSCVRSSVLHRVNGPAAKAWRLEDADFVRDRMRELPEVRSVAELARGWPSLPEFSLIFGTRSETFVERLQAERLSRCTGTENIPNSVEWGILRTDGIVSRVGNSVITCCERLSTSGSKIRLGHLKNCRVSNRHPLIITCTVLWRLCFSLFVHGMRIESAVEVRQRRRSSCSCLETRDSLIFHSFAPSRFAVREYH